jgi:hypothetical protein
MDQNDGRRPWPPNDADQTDSTGAAALVAPWMLLSEQLTPLIGESGFCALFGRAVRLSTGRFTHLGTCDSTRPVGDLLTSLTRTLNEIGHGHAADANRALLDTFTTLLGSLIGEALTKQLLHVAQESGNGQKHGQEQK